MCQIRIVGAEEVSEYPSVTRTPFATSGCRYVWSMKSLGAAHGVPEYDGRSTWKFSTEPKSNRSISSRELLTHRPISRSAVSYGAADSECPWLPSVFAIHDPTSEMALQSA